jgi:hypothetical protein
MLFDSSLIGKIYKYSNDYAAKRSRSISLESKRSREDKKERHK